MDVDAAVPVRGTYTKADPFGLLRTGYRFGDAALAAVTKFPAEPFNAAAASRVHVKAERDGKVVREAMFTLKDHLDDVKLEEVTGKGWHAVYGRPVKGTALPAVITLHGSEGGSVAKARGRAAQFAAQGLAVLAVNYFAYDHEAIKGVPTRHLEIPVETLDEARKWLAARAEVDANRVSLYGVSKGAEFALLAAARYDWVSSVVAVVPSDVVWEGYPLEPGAVPRSSWSVGGRAVPFVPLFQFDPKKEGMYRTNTERYDRSRAYHSGKVAAARVPIENAKARILLLAADRDEVWSSGPMARNVVERLTAAGKGDRVDVKIYPRAGHQTAGTGTFPIRLYGEQSPDADAKDLAAEGEAAADAWRRTIRFLKQ